MRVLLRTMAEVKRMCRVTARATTAFVGSLLQSKICISSVPLGRSLHTHFFGFKSFGNFKFENVVGGAGEVIPFFNHFFGHFVADGDTS